MKQRYIPKYIPVFLLLAAILLSTVSMSPFNKIYSDNPTNDDVKRTELIRECLRRNVLYGCSCDCNVTNNQTQVCNATTAGNNDPTKRCTIPYTAGPSNGNSTAEINPFPIVNRNNGLFRFNNNALDVGATITNIILLVLWVFLFFTLWYIFVGGYRLITAGSDDNRAQEGANTLKSAGIGFGMAILGIILAVVIASAAGVNTSVNDLEDQLINDEDETNPLFRNFL